MALEKHQNLRANVSRLHFAGESTSAQYFGFLQGGLVRSPRRGCASWRACCSSGRMETGKCECERDVPAANTTTTTVGGYGGEMEMEMCHYEPLGGATRLDDYDSGYRWLASSFEQNLQEGLRPCNCSGIVARSWPR